MRLTNFIAGTLIVGCTSMAFAEEHSITLDCHGYVYEAGNVPHSGLRGVEAATTHRVITLTSAQPVVNLSYRKKDFNLPFDPKTSERLPVFAGTPLSNDLGLDVKVFLTGDILDLPGDGSTGLGMTVEAGVITLKMKNSRMRAFAHSTSVSAIHASVYANPNTDANSLDYNEVTFGVACAQVK